MLPGNLKQDAKFIFTRNVAPIFIAIYRFQNLVS